MSLNNKILKAHHNKNLSLLVELYQEAADKVLTRQEQNYFRVQAYIYALEVGHHLTPILHKNAKLRQIKHSGSASLSKLTISNLYTTNYTRFLCTLE